MYICTHRGEVSGCDRKEGEKVMKQGGMFGE